MARIAMTTAASGTISLPHVDHVGSLIRPARLMEAWRSCEAGTVSEEELRAIQDECVREVVAVQQEIGLQVVTDGEFRRAAWSRGFLSAVDGFGMERSELTFRDNLAGNFVAADNRDWLARKMTPDQIAEAQRMAREWMEKHPPQ